MISKQCCAGLLGALIAMPSQAWDVEAEAAITSQYESNVNQTNRDERAGWNFQPSASIGILHADERFQADMAYEARRQINQNDQFDDATYLTGRGAINWGVVGDVWNVYAENQRTRTTIDNRLENTPDNQQIVDNTAVGTNVTIPIGLHQLILQAEQARTAVNEEGEDSDTRSALVGYQFPLGPTRQVTLTHSRDETEFDDFESGDYDSETTSLRFTSQTRILQVNAQVGHTTTELDDSDEEIDGVTGQLDLLWSIDEQSTLQFNAARDITDNLNGRRQFFFDEGVQPDLSEEQTLGGQIFVGTQYNLIGTTVLGANRLSLTLGRATRDYESVDTDELRHTARFRATRRASQRSGWTFTAEYAMSSFEDAPHDDAYRLGIEYDRELTSKLSMDIEANYIEQDSRALVRDFEGWTASITFRYTFLESAGDGGAGGRITNFGSRI